MDGWEGTQKQFVRAVGVGGGSLNTAKAIKLSEECVERGEDTISADGRMGGNPKTIRPGSRCRGWKSQHR